VDALVRQATTLSGDVRQISRRMDFISNAMQDDARMLRLVPAISVLQPLVRAGRDIGQQLAKRVEVAINGGDIEVDKALIDRIRDPLMHLLRNAIDHGLESTVERQQQNKPAAGQVTVSVKRISSQVEIRVQDDGRGIDVERLKQVAVERGELRCDELQTLSDDDAFALMFRPGLTVKREVSDISGRGVGLDVVKSNIQELKGQVRVESVRGEGTSFVITLPLTLSTERGLQVDVGGTTLVIPSITVQRIIEIEPEDILHIEGDHAVLVDGAPVPVRDLGGMLELPCQSTATHGARSAVVVHRGTRSMALLVDHIEGEREIVIKPLRYPLASVRYVSGATLTRQGQVIMVLSVPDLLDQFNTHIAQSALPMHLEVAEEHDKPHVLVVDDSITTRTLERNILEIHGYQVTVAMNGLEAWNLLQQQAFDLVVTDVEMPEMDGFTLTQRVRNDDALRETPVVIVSSLAKEEEQRRGLEVGASAYIVKGTFETQVLLDAVRRII
jgi:chemotaxis protein histidine kinase CheA